MPIFFICILIISFFYSLSLSALKSTEIDQHLQQQIIKYDFANRECYYSEKIPLETFLEFLDIYDDRPIKYNAGGIGSHGSFFLWYVLKMIDPALVIESGVWKGGSSWIIDQAAVNAQYIALDPNLSKRVYYSKRARYLTTDFSTLSLDIPKEGPTVVFFDDHQDAFQRVLECSKKGVKHIIFDDNYPHDAFDGRLHLTLKMCFTLVGYRDKANVLKKLIKHYYIFPQIVGKTASNLIGSERNEVYDIPAIWENINEIDVNFRERMQVFSNDSSWYRWMTYVELY